MFSFSPPQPVVDPAWAIYLDLDGVMADYDAGIRKLGFLPDPAKKNDLLQRGTNDPFKRAMYEAVKGTDYYRTLPLMVGALDLYIAIEAAGPIVCTAAPVFGDYETPVHHNPYWLGAQYHKRAWVEETLLPQVEMLREQAKGSWITPFKRYPIPDERFICTAFGTKHDYIGRKASAVQILIDDRRDNCSDWAAAGGIAILHKDALDTIAALRVLKEGRAVRDTFALVPGGGMIAGLAALA